MENHVVLYDGECGMCNFVVQWLMKENLEKNMLFAPQQGEWVARNFPDAASWNAVGYVKDGKIYYGFTAVRVMLSVLGRHWSVLGRLLWIIPKPLGDWGYGVVAVNRKRFFKSPACMLLSQEQRQRFLF